MALSHVSWQEEESMDLTDEQREVLEPLIPDPPRREDGRGEPGPSEKNGHVVPPQSVRHKNPAPATMATSAATAWLIRTPPTTSGCWRSGSSQTRPNPYQPRTAKA